MKKQINMVNPFAEVPMGLSAIGQAVLRALDVLLLGSGLIDTEAVLNFNEVERLAEGAGYSKDYVARGVDELLRERFLARVINRVRGSLVRTDRFLPMERLVRRYTLLSVRPVTAGKILY